MCHGRLHGYCYECAMVYTMFQQIVDGLCRRIAQPSREYAELVRTQVHHGAVTFLLSG